MPRWTSRRGALPGAIPILLVPCEHRGDARCSAFKWSQQLRDLAQQASPAPREGVDAISRRTFMGLHMHMRMCMCVHTYICPRNVCRELQAPALSRRRVTATMRKPICLSSCIRGPGSPRACTATVRVPHLHTCVTYHPPPRGLIYDRRPALTPECTTRHAQLRAVSCAHIRTPASSTDADSTRQASRMFCGSCDVAGVGPSKETTRTRSYDVQSAMSTIVDAALPPSGAGVLLPCFQPTPGSHPTS